MQFDSRINKLKARNLRTEDNAAYQRVHKWIARELGKAARCSFNEEHRSTRYHWSNISGQYKYDITDWQQLCPSCHGKHDYTEAHKKIMRIRSKGNTSHCKPILMVYPYGSWIKYSSSRIASQITGIAWSNISNAVTGYNKTAGGYRWRRIGG